MPVKKKIAKTKKETVKKAVKTATQKAKATTKKVAPKKTTAKKSEQPKKVVTKKPVSKNKVVSVKKAKPTVEPVAKKDTRKKVETVKKASPRKSNVKVEKSKPKVIKKQEKPKTVAKENIKIKPKVKQKTKKAVVEVQEKVVKTPPKPKVRYPDEDLKMFHDRIVEMRKEAIEELRMLRERLEDLTNYDFAEESMIYSMHMAEQGSEAFEKEKTYAQIQRINEYIKKLDEALGRIKDKTFGICRVCGCLIAKERLLAVPITTLSASYKIQKKCPEDGIDRIEPLKN
jgi:RNA polymerase-binding transcription factor DksA